MNAFLHWFHQMRFLTLVDCMVCTDVLPCWRWTDYISRFLWFRGHYVPLLVHLLLDLLELSLSLLVLRVEVLVNVRQYFSLLELSFVRFHLHVHLGDCLFIQLLFTDLFDCIRAQILKLLHIHTGLSWPELFMIFDWSLLSARHHVVVNLCQLLLRLYLDYRFQHFFCSVVRSRRCQITIHCGQIDISGLFRFDYTGATLLLLRNFREIFEIKMHLTF